MKTDRIFMTLAIKLLYSNELQIKFAIDHTMFFSPDTPTIQYVKLVGCDLSQEYVSLWITWRDGCHGNWKYCVVEDTGLKDRSWQ